MIQSDKVGKITYTMGPISIHQFSEFSKHGVNALRIFQFIRTKQGLQSRNRDTTKEWVIVDNKTLYKWFGVWYSKKHKILKALAAAKLIEIRNRGSGRAPEVRISCPTKLVN